MQITVWSNFLKKHNSMKRPSTEVGIIVNCTLKGECSVMNPVFELGSASYGLVEYVKWENNYYFVTDITMGINNYVIIHCTLDVLATWKEQILTNTAFVAYSSSNYDTHIIDRRIAMSTKTSVNRQSATNPFDAIGCILLTTISQVYGIATFAITTDAYHSLLEEVLGNASIIQDLKEMFGGVNQSIISCINVPVSRTSFPDAESKTVWLGSYETSISGYMTEGYWSNSRKINIPWIYDDFRRCSEYTSVQLSLPYVGVVSINTDSIINETYINVLMTMSCQVGSLIYTIRAGSDDRIIATYTATFGKQLPVATSQIDVQGVLRGAGQIIEGASGVGYGLSRSNIDKVSKNPLAAMANSMNVYKGSSGMIDGAINTAMALNTHSFSCFGGMGGNYGNLAIPYFNLAVTSKNTVTEPSSITESNGRPCFKELPLSTLTGYVETIGFAFDTNAIAPVRNLINEMMDSGVYIE